jgi:hypothetical protein
MPLRALDVAARTGPDGKHGRFQRVGAFFLLELQALPRMIHRDARLGVVDGQKHRAAGLNRKRLVRPGELDFLGGGQHVLRTGRHGCRRLLSRPHEGIRVSIRDAEDTFLFKV